MKRFLLDTSAILTLRDDEAGADRVAEILGLATQDKVKCYGCFMTLMEVHYRVWSDEDKAAGQLAYQQCLALPMVWLSNTDSLLAKAAEYKALYPLSIANAWIAAWHQSKVRSCCTKTRNSSPCPSRRNCCRSKSKKLNRTWNLAQPSRSLRT
ncbi:hypothetical protein GALL_440380 [mine drainage metagenome]|uniref:PIN domain-containing protein n=1 Tax=mine drainage metagenome TaxID=410659 RepID=A0A1J5Q2U0_9ZZZZ